MTKKAIIVGHGPSMLAEPMGHLIDEFEYVIRLKRCHDTLDNPKHYGTKTTHVGASLGIAGAVMDIPVENEYWAFMDSRFYGDESKLDAVRRMFHLRKLPLFIDPALCKMWDNTFMLRRERPKIYEQMSNSVHGDEQGEKHTSQGFKAIVYAATRLDVENIVLVGFDNLYSGEFTWSVTRGPKWKQYPIHDWAVEQSMLKLVEDTYHKKIGFLLPDMPEEEDEAEAMPLREDTPKNKGS